MRGISRRDVLKNLAVGAAGGSVLQMIPAEAAALAHQMVHKEKAASAAGKYTPKYFSRHQYETLTTLCDAIIPKDEKSGGAVEAGAPEFIDLLCSENEEFQLQIGGGLNWLDNTCRGPLRTHFSGVHACPEKGNPRSYCLPEERQERSFAHPRNHVFRQAPPDDLRRFLYQQNRHRGPAVHRKHRACRIPRLPSHSRILRGPMRICGI